MMYSDSQIKPVGLKPTPHCVAAEYGGKPLYPKPKELGFTGYFYKDMIKECCKSIVSEGKTMKARKRAVTVESKRVTDVEILF